MSEADNNGLAPQAEGTAPEAHMIPKHRFDEVNERLREAERRNAQTAELLNRLAPQQPPRGEEIDFEAMGLDQNIGKAVARIAEQIAERKVQGASARVQGMVGMAAQRADEARFMAQHGADKSKYMDKIQEYRERHYKSTGQALDVETAYKLVAFDEMQNGRRSTPTPAQSQPSSQAPAVVPGTPPAAAAPGNSAPPGAGSGDKSFDEMTVEEQEVYLSQQMSQGAVF